MESLSIWNETNAMCLSTSASGDGAAAHGMSDFLEQTTFLIPCLDDVFLLPSPSIPLYLRAQPLVFQRKEVAVDPTLLSWLISQKKW